MFAKQLQRISIKLGVRVYTNSFFGEFNFDFIFPIVKHVVTQAYVKLKTNLIDFFYLKNCSSHEKLVCDVTLSSNFGMRIIFETFFVAECV
jgi:hypothetical protein